MNNHIWSNVTALGGIWNFMIHVTRNNSILAFDVSLRGIRLSVFSFELHMFVYDIRKGRDRRKDRRNNEYMFTS